jgi:phosphoribosylanthranilate isomerase
MRVKICGMTRVDDAVAAARAGTDFVGLIFAVSPRRATLETARAVVGALPVSTQAVLVFRDAPAGEVVATLDATGARWVQLHGREPVTYLRDLATRRPHVALIKAWEVAGPSAADDLLAYLHEAHGAGVRIDAVILDAPKRGPHPGYECLAAISRRCTARPPEIWCAGGLTPANLVAAIRGVAAQDPSRPGPAGDRGRYDGVDVAGGVERSAGVKDPALVAQFIAAAGKF